MENSLYLTIGIGLGCLIGWLFARTKSSSEIQFEKSESQKTLAQLSMEFASYKASSSTQMQAINSSLSERQVEIASLKESLLAKSDELSSIRDELSITRANLQATTEILAEKRNEVETFKKEVSSANSDLSETLKELADSKATNCALTEKLDNQKKELESLTRKFTTEFENIANKMLDMKAEKFTELNKTNLSLILEPFGKNITEFKRKVEEVYDKESKERFSLGEKVKELAQLNQIISEEAKNLTKALKGEAKTQGRWGEMILESVLEKSGLVKDREYFIEHELKDKDGNHLLSDSEGKKMRPDAVIKYPDNRSVIIDSKVSLNAFTRLVASSDANEQKAELAAHVAAVKNHIIALSTKGYDDYDKSLDFVMMFIPSEPAYIAALQGDSDLWNFAYEKRILLLSPTNLITSLKLIADLWKREYQNRNALEIADRGAKLYDKFVGFVTNLEEVGECIEKAQGKYGEAYKQLSTGNDNLVIQATKLKNLGIKNKKELKKELVNASTDNLSLQDTSEK